MTFKIIGDSKHRHRGSWPNALVAALYLLERADVKEVTIQDVEGHALHTITSDDVAALLDRRGRAVPGRNRPPAGRGA